MAIELKLNKKYNDEIVYETMLKMGFYYEGYGNPYNYYRYENYSIGFNNNTIYINMIYNVLSELMVKNNIMKLSSREPSSLIDVQYIANSGKYFLGINNIEKKNSNYFYRRI